MNPNHCILSLTRYPTVLRSVVNDVDERTLTRRAPDSIGWSIGEILCHLADEEVEDFRIRLELTLSAPSKEWPRIDPEGVAVMRAYQSQDPHQALDRFVAARQENLRWLHSLGEVDWSTEHTHPRFGAIRAGDLLASWAAHDLLHLRQITKRLFQVVQAESNPYSTGYAGDWTA